MTASQKIYYRPICQTDQTRPKGAFSLAGVAVWFQTVERITRTSRQLIPATDVPDDVMTRLTAARADVAGLDMSRPQLMGILNLTPDSFSDGGRFNDPEVAIARAQQMVSEGATILDLGGESTRPGAETVSVPDEIARTAPVIKALRDAGINTPISIDTRKAAVGTAALAAGAVMLNDVSAMSYDPDMAALAATSGQPICLMHASGDPKTMQKDPSYDDVLLDVYDYLEARIKQAEAAGVARDRIIVDPGIGFGKTADHNLALIRGLSLFHGLGCPILLGVSRKRFIGTIGTADQADRRAPGSIAVGLEGLRQAVQILRIHDIEEHRQAVSLWAAISAQEQ